MIDETVLRSAISFALQRTDLEGMGRRIEGKVRDSYVGAGRRVLVATDRISAFDRVIGAIPFKGQVLNQLSAYWFENTADVVGNHVLDVPDPNVTVAREAQALPVEIIVRGTITGVTSTSLWTLYKNGVPRPYGLELPSGLKKNERLPTPVITPTTKAEQGAHDEPLSVDEVVSRGLVAPKLWSEVCAAALEIFRRGSEMAAKAGLILADTKYEMGMIDGRLCLIDEVHTPDSSRYWVASSYEMRHARGEEPEGLDKEYVRRWLASRGYAGDGPPPALDDAVVVELARRYIAAFEALTGRAFVPGEQPAEPRIARALLPFRLQ